MGFFFNLYRSGGIPYLIGYALVVAPHHLYKAQMFCHFGIQTPGGRRVPCGRCMPCRINKRRIWSARIMMEWAMSRERCYFVTLTYAPEHLPPGGSLDKRYIRQWLKDVQKRHSGSFRYYLVGEYGDASHRPHYHLAVFPEHPSQLYAFQNHWHKGFVHISEISHARARYLANYTTKKLTSAEDERLGGREPEFRTSSANPPLGSAFVEAMAKQKRVKEYVEKRGDVPRHFRLDGRIYPIADWPLKRLRELTGVPLTDGGRRANHPDYEHYHPVEDAKWQPEEGAIINAKIKEKSKAGYHRGKGKKI